MHNDKTSLHIFEGGSVKSQRNCTEILLDLSRGAVDPDFLFMGNNSRPHRVIEVSYTLALEDIQRMT